MLIFFSFLLLSVYSSIILYHVCLIIFPLKDISAVSSLVLLRIISLNICKTDFYVNIHFHDFSINAQEYNLLLLHGKCMFIQEFAKFTFPPYSCE